MRNKIKTPEISLCIFLSRILITTLETPIEEIRNPHQIYQNQFSRGSLGATTLKSLKSTNSILAYKHPSLSPSAPNLALSSTLYFRSFPETSCSFLLNILIIPRGIPLTVNIVPFYSRLIEFFSWGYHFPWSPLNWKTLMLTDFNHSRVVHWEEL